MPKITAIELENFQAIGRRTVIPIRDLTLIFGPNGAGKSSVFDALTLLQIITSDDWGHKNKKLLELLNRWSRNINSKNPTNEIGLGIHFFIDENWSWEDLRDIDSFNRLDRIAHTSIEKNGDYGEQFLNKHYRFYIKFKNFGELQSDWAVSECVISSENNTILELHQSEPDKFPTAILYKQDWISFAQLEKINGKHHQIHLENDKLIGLAHTLIFHINARQWFDKRFEGDFALEEEFIHLFQQVIDFFKFIIRTELAATPLVQASRTVPSIRETIALIPGEKNWPDSKKIRVGYRLEWSPLLQNLVLDINRSENLWEQMCRFLASTLSSDTPDEIDTDWDLLSPLGKINSFLREELFIENGYQISGEIFCVTPFHHQESYALEDTRYYPKLVHLHLIDNNQQPLEIEDVGSGIGYVLPVLASLVQDDISLIQQPELHLHPKLQGMLGEVVVKSIENKKYYRAFTLIETHSEHLLLRIMRLIKNSAKRQDEVIKPLTYENVSILYFDPQPNGETQVKRLRLAPDGQLIDRWPGGFFNERLKDIFDE